jgi:hypothetical protein
MIKDMLAEQGQKYWLNRGLKERSLRRTHRVYRCLFVAIRCTRRGARHQTYKCGACTLAECAVQVCCIYDLIHVRSRKHGGASECWKLDKSDYMLLTAQRGSIGRLQRGMPLNVVNHVHVVDNDHVLATAPAGMRRRSPALRCMRADACTRNRR